MVRCTYSTVGAAVGGLEFVGLLVGIDEVGAVDGMEVVGVAVGDGVGGKVGQPAHVARHTSAIVSPVLPNNLLQLPNRRSSVAQEVTSS